MNERLVIYVDGLFARAPHTHHIADIREELLSDLQEKYDDLIAAGHSETEAFDTVISGIGDLGELLGAPVPPKTVYTRNDDSFVEGYKEKVSRNSHNLRLKKAVSSSFWLLTVLVYLFISFISHAWHVTWLIFLLAAAVSQIIMLPFTPEGKRHKVWTSILWICTVVMYFLLSYATHGWAWTWLIFLLAAAIQQFVRLVTVWREEA